MSDRKSDKPGPMDIRPTPTKRGKTNPGLGREIQTKIGQQLRSYYDGLLEPTPDRFVALLRELDKKPSGTESSE